MQRLLLVVVLTCVSIAVWLFLHPAVYRKPITMAGNADTNKVECFNGIGDAELAAYDAPHIQVDATLPSHWYP